MPSQLPAKDEERKTRDAFKYAQVGAAQELMHLGRRGATGPALVQVAAGIMISERGKPHELRKRRGQAIQGIAQVPVERFISSHILHALYLELSDIA
jgi:hypothetical protein